MLTEFLRGHTVARANTSGEDREMEKPYLLNTANGKNFDLWGGLEEMVFSFSHW